MPAIRYGISNEAKAANKYAEYMTGIGHDVQVLECGLVFDEPFWKSMITKLTNFYQQHVMPEAMKV